MKAPEPAVRIELLAPFSGVLVPIEAVPGRSLQCHGESDRALDGSTDRRGFPLA
ncbi:hypothetical protein P3T23_005549 [Paraburkholderia sp. GAS448]